MKLHESIRYPALLVETKAQKYAIFDIASSQSDYVTFSRVPAKEEYVDGKVFDSCGQIFSYTGSAGWPRFGETSKFICELLIIPSLLAKAVAYVSYYGPDVKTARSVNLPIYKEEVLQQLSKHIKPKNRAELKSRISGASSFEEVIKAIDWWRYHGGKRDEDGHPIEDN
jgi:hypothetical protein